MSSMLSNVTDSLLQSFDIIRISPSPEDDERYRADNQNSIGINPAISLDAQLIEAQQADSSILSHYTPHNSIPSESSGPSIVSTASRESVIVNNRESIKSAEKNSLPQTVMVSETEKASLKNSRTLNSFNEIGPEIIMGNMQISNIGDYSYISEPKSDNSKVLELQERFKTTEEILKRNNIKLRQQYAKIQKYQNEVQEAAELSNKHIEDRDRKINALTATISALEMKLENMKAQNDWSLDNYRVNIDHLESENFEFKKAISEKLAIISNMSAEMKKLQDQNIYLANNSKNITSPSTAAAAAATISIEEHRTKLKEIERNNSALLAENLELRDVVTKCKNEIHAREVHLSEVQERARYKINDIERLTADLSKEKQIKAELNERIGVLEIGLADYKADFERERQERATIAGNREEILTELKMSQKRNQQLLDELKKYNAPASSQKNKASPPRVVPPKGNGDFQFASQSSFICPICSRNFTNFVALDNHVQQCIE